MNIIIFGPPGIGKGSTSSLLSNKLRIPHIPTGDILREETKKPKSKLKKYLDKGLLVPDNIVSEIILNRINKKDCRRGFILDGFPRTIKQAKSLEKSSIKFDAVINLKANTEVIIRRLSGRLMCPKDNTIYHTVNYPPKKRGICDKCGSKLIQRKDDTPEVIKNRIEVYEKDTKPTLNFYNKKDIVKKIDATKTLDEILDDILAVL